VPCGRSRSIRRGPHHGRITTLTPARITVAELRAGTDLDGVFACTRKDRLTARSGSAYLALELRDRTGSVPARAFRDADFLAGRFERGEIVRVRGRVERFRDELQVEVRDICRADEENLDRADFLPTAYRDLDELDGFLEHLAREVHDRDQHALLEAMLADEALRTELRRAPCSRGGHHAYLGGLLEHTVAVATLALETCTLHRRLNSDLLLTAAIVHDLGKTREFTYGAEIGLTDDGALVGHLVLGSQLLAEHAVRRPSFPGDTLLALQHCVLGHHGPDTLPGRRFHSAEALALFRLNAVDAAVKGALEQGLPGQSGPARPGHLG